jgi:hypothetical protein
MLSAMPTDRFWVLIERTLPFQAKSFEVTRRQTAALQSALAALSPQEIEAFEVAFSEQLARSYSWDLWGAYYVANGGASDDAFEYFRRWLISKGRRVFEQVLSDPDSLADLITDETSDVLEYEEFAYVARETWAKKTCRSADDFACGDFPHYPDNGPTGTPFKDDKTHLSKRYPKLWKRFGENWLD